MDLGRKRPGRTVGSVVVVVVKHPSVKEVLARVVFDETVTGRREGAARVESRGGKCCGLHGLF